MGACFNLFCLLIVVSLNISLAAKGTDDDCFAIGGSCQDVSMPCYGVQTYYTGLCAPPSTRLCCAQKTEDAACKGRGGWCDYNCEGSISTQGLCGGGLSCCIALY